MKPKLTACSLLTVVLLLLLPALIGCSSGGTVVEAKPQTAADLTTPDPRAQVFE